ncbi:hypothetical protein, partial [Segatella hominis]|uniref:hypothetical protein n=1 Tax=Segatella hominis TaxID=2518605 RepID=UPI003AB03B1F
VKTENKYVKSYIFKLIVPKNIRFRFFSIRNQSKEKFMILKRKNRRMAKKVLIIGLAPKT